MAVQLSHQTTNFSSIKKSLIIICDGLDSPANIGGLFRLSDALGLEAIYFCKNMPDLNSVRLKRTSRSTHTHFPHRFFEQTLDAIAHCKELNYQIVALELTKTSTSLNTIKAFNTKNIALVLGNEKHGITEEVLKSIKTHVHINMHGINSSMNVVQAAAITCYSLTKDEGNS